MAYIIGISTKIEAQTLAKAGYEVSFPTRAQLEGIGGEIDDDMWQTPPVDVDSIPDGWTGWTLFSVDVDPILLADLDEIADNVPEGYVLDPENGIVSREEALL